MSSENELLVHLMFQPPGASDRTTTQSWVTSFFIQDTAIQFAITVKFNQIDYAAAAVVESDASDEAEALVEDASEEDASLDPAVVGSSLFDPWVVESSDEVCSLAEDDSLEEASDDSAELEDAVVAAEEPESAEDFSAAAVVESDAEEESDADVVAASVLSASFLSSFFSSLSSFFSSLSSFFSFFSPSADSVTCPVALVVLSPSCLVSSPDPPRG